MIKLTAHIAFLVIVSLVLVGCSVMKPNQLFEDSNAAKPEDTLFYTSSEIYHDFLSSEAWFTHQDHCLTVKTEEEATYDGDLGLYIAWNRQAEGCPWLGLGFGWDGWTGKDLSSIKNVAAISFWVRTLTGERSNLPWAIGLEDFTGSQAWLGMSTNAVKAEAITTEWTRIELPLSEFNWHEQNADISSIKQIIFNFEGDGEIYLDEIHIVPYYGGFRKRAHVQTLAATDFIADGLTNDNIWNTPKIQFGSNEVHLALIDSFLCVAMQTEDETPLSNNNIKGEVYNGDAFEIAFSTDKNANPRRSRYLSSDQHLGFALGDKVTGWNWRKKIPINTSLSATRKTETGYVFEIMIDLKELDLDIFEINMLYGLELAVDHGTQNGRDDQDRWNDPANTNFSENPFVWGEMIFYNSETESNTM